MGAVTPRQTVDFRAPGLTTPRARVLSERFAALGAPSGTRGPGERRDLTPQDCLSQMLSAIEAEASRSAGRPQLSVEDAFLAISCMVSAPTLAQAIDRGSRFYAALARAAGCEGRSTMSLGVHGSDAELRFYSGGPAPDSSAHFVSALLGAAFHAKLFGWLIGDEIKVASVATSYRRLMTHEALAEIAPWPIVFACDLGATCDVRIVFQSRHLSRPVIRTGGDLEGLNLIDLLFALMSPASPVAAVRQILLAALNRGAKLPSAARLAALCNRSPATLRRHLARESTSIRKIREQCVRELALLLLEDRRMPLGEVAARLGFSDAPNFRRAFRRWTGSSPAAFRRNVGSFERSSPVAHDPGLCATPAIRERFGNAR